MKPDYRSQRMLVVFFLCSLLQIQAQRMPATLESCIKKYFQTYKMPNYRPHNAISMVSCKLNERERSLDIHANEAFAAQPFTSESVATIYRELKNVLPSGYANYNIKIYANKKEISQLIPNFLRKDYDKKRLWKNTYKGKPWVRNISRPINCLNGLENRHIALWASHGRYYKHQKDEWVWQRPNLFGTNEDLFTQTIVVPYLMPMLENAGAIIYSPRERDWQTNEVIVDNDTPVANGQYLETSHTHTWETTDKAGFSSNGQVFCDMENPFANGTARCIQTTRRKSKTASCTWIPNIPQSGPYAVYVAYQTLPNSTDNALYTIYHKGGNTQFHVNQQMGGGTWVYLGTFEFEKGINSSNRVTLTNESHTSGVVTADAVRFGGGMGNIARSKVKGEETTSQLPRFLEGARYATQWSGFPYNIYSSKNGENDYGDDINARSYSANELGGKSPYMPGEAGRHVPIEMMLAVHSDAGFTTDRSIYGSLGICTTENELYTHFSSGVSRMASYDLASMLLQNIVTDLTDFAKRPWTRRELFDRNYSETRNPEVPSAIIETLSHQNFEDLRYGHDPNFKFTLARAIYKSALKFISFQHQTEYVVQPLPVKQFCARIIDKQEVELRWKPTADPLEETAAPTGYIVYTKMNDGAFDNGEYVKDCIYKKPLMANVQYCFKVTAVNDGGESFPSEILTVYQAVPSLHTLLIVNGFERLSGPAIIDTPDSLGFDLQKDWGVPYKGSTGFCGYQRCFDRTMGNGTEPDMWGYSSEELVGQYIPGNTFNYPYIHGKAIRKTPGISFVSSSKKAFESGNIRLSDYKAIDLILGLEKNCSYNIKAYKTFTPAMQKRLSQFCQNGGNLFVSGAYIASDMQGNAAEQKFIQNVLKYSYSHMLNDSLPTIRGLNRNIPLVKTLSDREQYPLRSSDCIAPVVPAFAAFVNNNGECMGTAYKGNAYKTICLAFPFECIAGDKNREDIMKGILQFITQ